MLELTQCDCLLQIQSTKSDLGLKMNKSGLTKSQRQLYDALWKRGVAVNLHYIPVHRQPYYENLGFNERDFPEAEQFHCELISLPMYPMRKFNQQEDVLTVIQQALY